MLLGTDTGPNPAEALLHALAACLTTSLVYVAAPRGVTLTRVESTFEGDRDVRGALGLSDEVRNGFERIRVSFKVEGDAPAEKLHEVVDRAKSDRQSSTWSAMTCRCWFALMSCRRARTQGKSRMRHGDRTNRTHPA